MAFASTINHYRQALRGFCLSLLILTVPHQVFSQPVAAHLEDIPATAETMAEGGLFFPGRKEGMVLKGQQVAATVEIDVSGMVARTTVTQHFSNPKDEWVEALYVFPLPEKSAVDRLQLTVGERVITAKIAEREQAERDFEQARANGQTASMLSQERPNIFTNAVTNIGPRETVSVQIGFELPIDYYYDEDAGPKFSFRFPMAIMPRYMPGQAVAAMQASYVDHGLGWSFDTDQVADASRISPPIDAVGGVNPVSFTIDLAAGFPIGDLESSYHTVSTKAGEDGYTITLAEGVVPADRDFELMWSPVGGVAPAAGLFSETTQGYDHHLVMIAPPVPQAENEAPPPLPRDITFILDKSGSMSGEPMRQAKAALERALAQLTAADRFQVIAFDTAPEALFRSPMPGQASAVDDALDWLGRLEAGGGTEMASALQLAFAQGNEETPAGRLGQIVFITDGAVGNEAALFSLINDRLGDRRLFTVGIGSAPNGHFMRDAAHAGRGTFTFIGNQSQVGERMARLFRQLEAPVLTDINLPLPSGAEMYPPRLPDLYEGEPVSFVLRLPQGTTGELSLGALHHNDPWAQTLPLNAPTEESNRPGIAAVWAREKIAAISRDHHIDHADKAGGITQVALSYSLLSQYTSLLAVDDVARRPAEATLTSGQVAGNMPAGATMPPPTGTPAQPQAVQAAALTPLSAPHNPFSAGNLPQTATPADLLAMIGSLLTLIGFALLWYRRRQEWRLASAQEEFTL
ncbi:MAG: marine proteobacterial sortase target protein [Pseudomonadota bacterium]